jgi:subtilase family serine protease
MNNLRKVQCLIAAFGAMSLVALVNAQTPLATISQAVNEANLVTLSNNTRPEAVAGNDLGIVPDTFPMNHLLLQLQRSAQGEAALRSYIDQLHDRTSPDFHKWLTPAEFAAQFGVAQTDVSAVTSWLTSRGFTINGTQGSGLVIDFSGTAGQVRQAFHTEIHNLNVAG